MGVAERAATAATGASSWSAERGLEALNVEARELEARIGENVVGLLEDGTDDTGWGRYRPRIGCQSG